MRVILVARSTSISAGGLVFDPKPWIWLGLAAVVFSLLFWFPLVRGITRSLAQITQATRRIADGRFDVRVSTSRRDELGQVGEAVNEMAARLDGFVTGQKRFLGGVAHELCSPLARLQMALGVLDQRVTAEHAGYVKSASEKAEQMAALIAELLSFSKASFGGSAVHLQPVNVREACEEAVRREECPAPGVRLDIPADLAVAADRDLLVRALANLLRNAQRHAPQAGPIELGARRGNGEVAIHIADSGPGVAEDELPKIFDAFYRVDSSRDRQTGGAGLGLTIVRTCIESCGGTVTARNRKPHGLEVSIQLPVAGMDGAPAKAVELP
jgi:two-component system sensor histidine kinase CpxA